MHRCWRPSPAATTGRTTATRRCETTRSSTTGRATQRHGDRGHHRHGRQPVGHGQHRRQRAAVAAQRVAQCPACRPADDLRRRMSGLPHAGDRRAEAEQRRRDRHIHCSDRRRQLRQLREQPAQVPDPVRRRRGGAVPADVPCLPPDHPGVAEPASGPAGQLPHDGESVLVNRGRAGWADLPDLFAPIVDFDNQVRWDPALVLDPTTYQVDVLSPALRANAGGVARRPSRARAPRSSGRGAVAARGAQARGAPASGRRASTVRGQSRGAPRRGEAHRGEALRLGGETGSPGPHRGSAGRRRGALRPSPAKTARG